MTLRRRRIPVITGGAMAVVVLVGSALAIGSTPRPGPDPAVGARHPTLGSRSPVMLDAPMPPGDAPGGSVSGKTVTLVGAGDIAGCGSAADSRTAQLIASMPDAIVFTAGDNAYERGSPRQFQQCYGPTWGAFLARTRPVIGNHEMKTDQGAPYFAYFGTRAGTSGQGWYSYQAGTWHVVVLNGNCDVAGCGRGSSQLHWLEADLASHPGGCTIAIWHQPRFTSGVHRSDPRYVPFWDALYHAGVEIVINGHDHDYERFSMQSPFGVADRTRGIREFVVGTGGRELRRFPGRPIKNSKVRDASTFGVLKLVLAPGSYQWQFIGVPGSIFTDAGHGVCH